MLWVDVLNRSLEWAREEGAWALPHTLLGDAAIDAVGGQAIAADLASLRRLYVLARRGQASGAEATDIARAWIENTGVRWEGAASIDGFALPGLRARRSESPHPPALEAVLATAALGFLAHPESVNAVARCQGIVRMSIASPWGTEDDREFAQAAGLHLPADASWRQCPRLVHAPRLARYCSKACSNAAFALRKGAAQPHYFAAKQAQYRARKRRPPAAATRRSPFMFVD